MKLIAALACRSRVRWAIVLFAFLLIAAATPIDVLDLNDSAVGDPADGPIVGEQVPTVSVRLLHETILDVACSNVSSSFLAGPMILEVPRVAPNAGPRPLPTPRPWILARALIGPQATGPSAPPSDPA